MKGDIVTLDGLDDGTIWPDGEFEVLTEPRLTSGKDKALFGGLGYVNVRRVADSTGHLVVPVAHIRTREGRR